MPTFSQGDVVRVPFPFPYVERPVLQRRPAVVVSAGAVEGVVPLLWVVMITSAQNPSWPSDISLAGTHNGFGLRHPCVIRPTKIATIGARGVDRIGALDGPTLHALLRAILATVRPETPS